MKPLIILFAIVICSTSRSNAQTPVWTQVAAVASANIEGTDIAVDQGGNVYVTGFYNGAPVFGTDTIPHGNGILIVKYDSLGNFLWVRNASNGNNMGNCYTSRLSIDDDGNVYLSGVYADSPLIINNDTLGYISISENMGDFFILKFRGNGDLVYAKSGGSCYAPYLNFPLLNDAAGNLYFMGNFYSPQMIFGNDTLNNASEPARTQLFLVKFDSTGNTVWAKTVPGTSFAYQSAMTMSPKGDIVVSGVLGAGSLMFGADTLTGTAISSIFLAGFDTSGNAKWAKVVAENVAVPPAISDVTVLVTGLTTDYRGDICLAGIFGSALTIGNLNFYEDPGPISSNTGGYYAKFDNKGNLLWANAITASAASGPQSVWDIAHDPNNDNIIIVGGFDCNSFNIGDAGFVNPDVADQDASFLAELDSNGNVVCKSVFNGGGDDWVATTADKNGNIYMGGDFLVSPFKVGSESFFPGAGEKLFATKFEPCTGTVTAVHNTPVKNEIEVFPSPASDVVNIRNAQNEHLEIYNLMGVAVISQKIISETETVNVADLPDGLYIVQITDASGKRLTSKIEKISQH